jgi:glycosyltransferase involved in cell wall biosynthesis
MSDLLVSIALCTYNGERWLPKQLDSLLTQTYKLIEVIAVDDQSEDGTWEILSDYAAKDSRIRIYQNKSNLGHGANFEKAIKLCNGNYIAVSDQDDIWERNKIALMIESAANHVMVYHNSDFIDEYDIRIGNQTLASKNRMYEGDSCLPVILANSIHGHTMLFDSKLKDYIFPFKAGVSHDWTIAFAAFNAGRVKYLDKVLVHYRQHQNSVTDILEQKEKTSDQNKPAGLQRLPVDTNWLSYCLEFKNKKDEALVNEACTLFLNLFNGKDKIQNFFFMMKHFDLLFYNIGHKKRSLFSKINFVRKLCFN